MASSKRILFLFLLFMLFMEFSFTHPVYGIERRPNDKTLFTHQQQAGILKNSKVEKIFPLLNAIGVLDNTLLVLIIPLLIIDVLSALLWGFVFIWTHYSVFLGIFSVISGFTLLGATIFWLNKRRFYRKHAVLKGWKLWLLLTMLFFYIADIGLISFLAFQGLDNLVNIFSLVNIFDALFVGYCGYRLSKKAKEQFEKFIPRLNQGF